MSKVLVRKQVFDPKQAANNMAAVTDLSSGGAVEQLGLLNLLSGPQKPLAPAAAKELGYDMDSDEYKRLRTGERIGQGLAGLYGGYRMMDAVASGRSPTSAIGAGAGAYGSVAPIARRVGVRAASRGMKPAEPAPEKVAVKPPVPEKIEYNPVFDPVTFGQMERGRADTIQNRFQPTKVAVAQPQPFRQPTPQEARVNNIEAGQNIFRYPFTGSQLPRDTKPMTAASRVKVAQPTVAMNPPEKNMLSYGYGAEVNKPGETAEGFKTATTQTQQGDKLTANQKRMLSEQRKLHDEYEDPDAEEQAREQGQLQGA